MVCSRKKNKMHKNTKQSESERNNDCVVFSFNKVLNVFCLELFGNQPPTIAGTNMKVIFLTVGLQLTLCFFCTAGANEWDSCEGRCGALFDGDRTNCQCNSVCVGFGDCCTDFLQICTSIHLDGNNPLEGLVIVKEKKRDVGYICHNGLWLLWEASAACADLGYYGGESTSTDTSVDVGSLPILHSYVKCNQDATRLNQCEFITNVTTQDLCVSDAQDDCCMGLLGVRCTNQTDDELTSPSTTVQMKTGDNHEPSTRNHTDDELTTAITKLHLSTTSTSVQKKTDGSDEPNAKSVRAVYIYIIIGVVCVLLITGVVLVVVVRSRRKGRKQLRNPPATDHPTVAMGNVTSVQSADSAPTPFLAHETLGVKENTYASDPTSSHTYTGVNAVGDTGTNEGGEDEYTYVDVPPVHSPSEDLQHTYMDAEVLLVTSRNISSDDNDYGLIDNVLYKQF
ncbi:uncharacterized protein LOC100889106 [Strongylocentrotus purpuratus]|uniref:Uncharacterized protein n=1 Tax=Strongylocentrotus purpuratus TaxID=7668 RepID=A0A7M7N397_STRPU|nr:uncharacterized protein LOC100889106 [Strongylocentrotus purpuratus]